MKTISLKSIILIAISCLQFISCTQKNNGIKPIILWYDSPASQWDNALPIGNGRLGAMVYGTPGIDTIQVNEESLWGGIRANNNNPKALQYLPEIQKLVLNGGIDRAKMLADKYLLGTPYKSNSYQTLGEIFLHFNTDNNGFKNYRRELDITNGIIKVSYADKSKNINYEVFSSAPDNITVIYIYSDKKENLDVDIMLKRIQDAKTEGINNGLLMTGQIIDPVGPDIGPGGPHMRFAAQLEVTENDGKTEVNDSTLKLYNFRKALLVFTASTNYNLQMLDIDSTVNTIDRCEEIIKSVRRKSYEKIRNTHVADHSSLMNRVIFELPGSNYDTIATDKRLEMFKQGNNDPQLITSYFQFGRYLLIGSSRKPGVLPANLQGLWNPYIWAPWNSDYHTNINLQMNYWPAEVCNLSETALPLIDFIDINREPGRVTAREMYGAKGWMLHHTTDIFGKTAIMDGIEWGTFPMGAAWMTFPIYRHFEYTQDTVYLINTAYPIMKESAEFIMDFLINDKNGNLVTVPSYSPENSYIVTGTKTQMKFSYGSTIDIQIITELFLNCIKAAKIVHDDSGFIDSLLFISDKLPHVRIGANGTIMEWIEDYEEAEPGHRHISHLLGLHPGTQITPETPELFKAAAKTIERRLTYGGGHTGWSRAWIINFYARLQNGDEAYKHLHLLLKKSTLPNLFDTHPPFQIDGNFGSTAGIAEMLLQSHLGKIQLLPALPTEWPEGKISGLKARGNFTVDMIWSEDSLKEVTIISNSGSPLHLEYKDKQIETLTKQGQILKYDGNLKAIKK